MLIPIFSTEKENDQMVGPWNCQPSCWLNNKWSINDEMYRQSTNAYSWPVWLIWKKTAQHMWKPRTPPQSGWASPFSDSSDSFPPPLDRWIIWTQGSTHILSIPHVAAQCSIKPLGFQLDLACYRPKPNWSLYSAVYRVAFQILALSLKCNWQGVIYTPRTTMATFSLKSCLCIKRTRFGFLFFTQESSLVAIQGTSVQGLTRPAPTTPTRFTAQTLPRWEVRTFLQWK